MYSKKKLFIFHNEKVITHLEQQPNQSFYIESLILSDIENNINPINIQSILQEIKQQICQKNIELNTNEVSNSISNIFNQLT